MEPRRKSAIKQAASGAKLVGGLFVLLGGIPMLPAVLDFRGWIMQLGAIATTLMLVGPGVWYIIAGVFLTRNQYWTIRTTYKVALGQVAAIALAIVGSIAMAWAPGAGRWMVLMPAILSLFFLPALVALMFDVRKAGRELEAMEGRGFAVEALPVVPVDSSDTDPPAEAGSPMGNSSLDA